MSEKRRDDPPISHRLGREREVRFASFREKTGLRQSDALNRLIDHGLEAEGFGSEPPPKPKSRKTPGAKEGRFSNGP